MWHWLRNDGLLRDGRDSPPDNVWLEHKGIIRPCLAGLHASECSVDALLYAPGTLLCRVELEGELVSDNNDKWVGRRRKILWRVDKTETLRRFASDQVLDKCESIKNSEVKEYLTTLNEKLRWGCLNDARRTFWHYRGTKLGEIAWCITRIASKHPHDLVSAARFMLKHYNVRAELKNLLEEEPNAV